MELRKWNLLVVKNGYDILKTLPSHKLYYDFNQVVESDKKNVYEEYCSEISTYKNEFQWLPDFCVQFAKNLTNVNITKDVNSKHSCLLLNYWIYEEILKKHKNKTDNVYDMKFFRKIYEIGKKINDKKSDDYYCACYFYGTLGEWKEEKDLHDYFKNYEDIKKKISSISNECSKYHTYLMYIKEIYKEHEDICCIFGDIYCHRYFNCDYNKSPSNLISKLKCHNQEKKEYELDSNDEEKSENPKLENSMIIKYGRCIKTNDDKGEKLGYKCVFPENQKLAQEGETSDSNNRNVNLGNYISAVDLSTYKKLAEIKVNSYNNQGNDAFNKYLPKNMLTLFSDVPINVRNSYFDIEELSCLYGNSKKSEICKKFKEKREHELLEKIIKSKGLVGGVNRESVKVRGLPGGESATSVEYNDQLDVVESGHDIMKGTLFRVGAVTVLSLGTIVLLFLYYKFTPFGSWLNRKVLKKKNKNYNFQEGFKRELIKNSSQGNRIYSKKKRVPIAYHQMHNI
ncbi:variable surface protein [Plasmodium gonderi]|uniref:Variable surface protein n=1 Tax=Plasmodium gonderi TaxID=77519 RepID=A0A1Y1JNQ6_PLAGO|nr:variable surface protein [Plasmodium gonderi]GAW82033.1 variable surface protein [Plasmodium gonderi]